MNTFTLLGRMVKDPELLYGAQSNKAYCRFSLAVERKYGEKKTDFFDLIAFDKKAETLAKYAKKGDQILVSGNLQQDTQEVDGKKRNTVKLAVSDFDFIHSKSDKFPVSSAESQKETTKRDDFMDIPENAEFSLPFH